jgi:uncharacterized membrane protein YfcA
MDGPDAPLVDAGLSLAGFASWTISTLSGGGGSVLIVAVVAMLLHGHRIAPVITIASTMASPARIILFARFSDWRVERWYVPGAVAVAAVGGWAFVQVSTQFIQLCVGLFLVSTFWQYRMGDRPRSFQMRLHWFPAVSVVSGLTSALVGASGLLANPFYLNDGLEKEQLLATRAVNSLMIQIVKIGIYLSFEALNWDLVRHGVATGSGAILAICITRPWLRRLDGHRFRQFSVFVMLVAGRVVIWQQRGWLAAQWW